MHDDEGFRSKFRRKLVRWVRKVRYRYKVRHMPPGASPQPILDAGCGCYPLIHSHVVADCTLHHIEDPAERVRLRGRYVVCDLHRLPFRDQSFAFVHCSNVLEHVANPERAYAELRRVGRHGFAECPNALRENWLIHPADHLWIIRWRKGAIETAVPRVRRCGGFQILPLPFMPWFRLRFRLFWKAAMFLGDSVLHVMYNEVRW